MWGVQPPTRLGFPAPTLGIQRLVWGRGEGGWVQFNLKHDYHKGN